MQKNKLSGVTLEKKTIIQSASCQTMMHSLGHYLQMQQHRKQQRHKSAKSTENHKAKSQYVWLVAATKRKLLIEDDINAPKWNSRKIEEAHEHMHVLWSNVLNPYTNLSAKLF